MRKKISLLFTSMLLFAHGIAYALTSVDHPPLETIVLELPNGSYADWKEIVRSVNEKEGMVERIPLNQTANNWSELIGMQHYSISDWDKSLVISIKDIVDHMEKTTRSAYPGNKVTWRILEKNESDIIYEWILHKGYKNVPPQHEIVRAFLTKNCFHRIAFAKRYSEMSVVEREKWIKLLRESVTVVPIESAINNSNGFSMAENFKDSVDLGATFQDWSTTNTCVLENGYTLVCHIPPSQKTSYITECLEVTTMPNFHECCLDQFFEIERKIIQNSSPKKVRFQMLKQSPSEVIYCYSHPADHLVLTVIVRTFLANQGYYSISYRRGLPAKMKQAKISQWQRKLETIKIRGNSKVSDCQTRCD